jgi:protein phosphatase PTC7
MMKIKWKLEAVLPALSLQNEKLEYSNLGDSGFLIYRPSHGIIFRTIEQQHYFNAPFQLMYIGHEYRKKNPKSSEGLIVDHPRQALQGEIDVQVNDLVVLGTDGLFDNLFDDEIVSVLKEYVNLDEISKELLKGTYEKSQSLNVRTPFAINANKHGMYFSGGKQDDITIIIGRIEKEN